MRKWSLSTASEVDAVSRLFPPCRYALQLLTPASILAKLSGRTEITLEDVGETDSLFLDAKTSARMLAESGNQSQYLR